MLFIAGPARSGSTLLERIIGTHDGFCSAGELRFIWHRSFAENQLCGCGVPFLDCRFWGEVSGSAFGVEPALVDAHGAAALQSSVEHKRRLARLMITRRADPRSALAAYGSVLERLYGAILDVADARAVVDSSKDPRHGFVLARLPRVDLHVIHLVRDPRAIAFSWQRRRPRPEIHWKAADMMIQPARASAARWTTHNAIAELLSTAARSYRRVRYEDFVAEPASALSRLLRPFAWHHAGAELQAGADVVLTPAHTVAGNPLRFANGPLAIKLDDEWRERMPVRDRLAVDALTWPLLAHYGYSLRGAT